MPDHRRPSQPGAESCGDDHRGLDQGRGLRDELHQFPHFDSITIAARPGHGSLRELGVLTFFYKPTPGFKGVDTYTLRLCGREATGQGCATVTYKITVE